MSLVGVKIVFFAIYFISVTIHTTTALKSPQLWILKLATPKAYQQIKNSQIAVSPENYIIQVVYPDKKNMINTVSDVYRRRIVEVAQVEEGPGSIKSDVVEYPENFFQNRLKVLLMLKNKKEALKLLDLS